MPSFISSYHIYEIKKKKQSCAQFCGIRFGLFYFKKSGKYTSEEHSTSPWVAFGRGNLILNVAHNWFGDFIKSLGTILQKQNKQKKDI